MKKKMVLIAVAALLLSGCSAKKTDFLQPFSSLSDKNGINADISKDKRLESYAKNQVMLIDSDAEALSGITAEAALLFKLDEASSVLLCKNSYGTFQPGNFIKVIAGEYILSKYDYYSEVMIDSDIFGVDSNLWSCHFTKGDSVKMKDLIYAAVMYGANDVMIPLSKYTAGDLKYFAQELNTYMKSLGAENTNILGCYSTDINGQKTTAFDIYLFLQTAMNDNDFVDIITKKTYSCQYSNSDVKQGLNFENNLPYFKKNITSTSGLIILGGVCESETVNPTQMLTLAEDNDGNKYVAFVAGCKGYDDCLNQTEEILSRIGN